MVRSHRKTHFRLLIGLILLASLLEACGTGAPTVQATGESVLGGPPTSEQSGGGFQPPQSPVPTPSFGRQDCPETPASAGKPAAPEAGSFSAGGWYKNDDGSLWVGAPAGGARKGENQFAWVKPAGAQLQVNGQRMDIMAEPMSASLPPDNTGGYLTGTLTFSTDGCWQITSQAGSSSLQFILYVAP